jgi:hypothetical protein
MAIELVNGVRNAYGPRNRHEATGGVVKTEGTVKEVEITFTGENYSLVSYPLPAGATIVGNALVEVDEVFVIGGTTPNIAVGVSGSPATNYVALIPELSLEALGTYSIASAGTLAVNTPLAAAATLVVGLEGDTTTTGAGKARVVFAYRVM